MSCVFCGIIEGTTPASFVQRDDNIVAFLDARPLFKGHVLVVPRAHVVTLAELPAPLLPALFGVVQRLARAVLGACGAQGTFIALNNVVSQIGAAPARPCRPAHQGRRAQGLLLAAYQVRLRRRARPVRRQNRRRPRMNHRKIGSSKVGSR